MWLVLPEPVEYFAGTNFCLGFCQLPQLCAYKVWSPFPNPESLLGPDSISAFPHWPTPELLGLWQTMQRLKEIWCTLLDMLQCWLSPSAILLYSSLTYWQRSRAPAFHLTYFHFLWTFWVYLLSPFGRGTGKAVWLFQFWQASHQLNCIPSEKCAFLSWQRLSSFSPFHTEYIPCIIYFIVSLQF